MVLPDGVEPYRAMQMFAPWVDLATQIMDGDGAWVCLPWPGSYMEQPDFDMRVLGIIRARWNELRTQDMKNGG